MKIQLSDHFTYKRLIRFVLPSIVMMVFTSIYGVVDSLFVSNYAGKTPFAAVNLIMPVIMIMGTVGLMIGTGGSAIVSKTLGEGDRKKANEYFSLLIYASVAIGILISIFGFKFLKPIAQAMGAEGEMLTSSFFTALNNGFVSAAISFSRTLLFQIAAVMLLPIILEIDGIWLAIVAAEAMAMIVMTIFLITNKKKYKY